METKVLTQEELQQIKDIQQEKSILVEQFGFVEYSIQDLEQQKQTLNSSLFNLKQKEWRKENIDIVLERDKKYREKNYTYEYENYYHVL
jgi:hypothetical protein